MKTQICDITIIYREDQQSLLEEVRSIIEKNSYLVYNALPEDEKTIDLTDDKKTFNDFFHNVLDTMFHNPVVQGNVSDKNFASSLYLHTIAKKKRSRGENSIVAPIPGMTDELFGDFVAYKYFEANGTFNDLVEYLKVKNREEEIYNWLKSSERWNTFNNVLNMLSSFVTQGDDDFVNIASFLMYSFVDLEDEMKNASYVIPTYTCPKISKEEFDSLVYEFLKYINAPVEWYNEYNYMKANNLIITEEDSNKIGSCSFDEDGVFKVKIENSDNLKGFQTFAHEFAHYLSKEKGTQMDIITISEIPSIYYEKLSVEFLKSKGYSDEELKQILDERRNNNAFISFDMKPLICDLIRFLKFGRIDKEDKIPLYTKQLESVNRIRQNIKKVFEEHNIEIDDPSKFEEVHLDIGEEIDRDCDIMTDRFVEDGFEIINGYQYLLGTYLVEMILEKQKTDPSVSEKMIDITNNIDRYSVREIINLFGLDLSQSGQGRVLGQ